VFYFKKKNNVTPAIDLTKKKKMTYGKHKKNMGTLTKLKSHQLKKKKLSEPFKTRQISKTRNLLNSRFRLNQETQFLTNLILISESKSNKEKQIKRFEKTQVIFKINEKS
jgi:hypothetical protein